MREACFLRLVTVLAHHPDVLRVAPKPVFVSSNGRTSQIVQSAENADSLSSTL
eukprot:CAMPEP_0118989370 /NCGR_PEP_ID=MMETSP1173-20130426/47896_1 /TAXON_ID=1034831 /ORGANISM="Rhizochromulina marina cf, Strain CCMP1243" /LENGTH=52 /DNA_ID=CAMNT_0006940357 /DNA_START=1 /DNA_END=156 /DNA_ORIENTATION=-